MSGVMCEHCKHLSWPFDRCCSKGPHSAPTPSGEDENPFEAHSWGYGIWEDARKGMVPASEVEKAVKGETKRCLGIMRDAVKSGDYETEVWAGECYAKILNPAPTGESGEGV